MEKQIKRSPLLTLGIPTFNRSLYLNKAIESVFKEITSNDLEIEVLISDNNSTDNTKEIVEKWNEKFEINYSRNKTNLGFDKNIDLIVKNAKSDFVLIMSDDDIIYPNSLNLYLDILKANKNVSIIIGKAKFMDNVMKKEIKTFSDKAFKNFKESKVYEFENGLELFSHTKKIFCGITGVLFNKRKYLEEQFSAFYNSQFLHTAAIFKILSYNNSKVFIINKPCFYYRLGNSKNSKIKSQYDIMKTGLGILDLLIKIKNFYPLDVWNPIYNKELNWSRSLLIGIKAREGIAEGIIEKYKVLIDENRKLKFIDYIIFNSPDIFFRFFYLIYRFFKFGSFRYNNL